MRSKRTVLGSFIMLALIWAAPGAWAQHYPVIDEYSTELVTQVTVAGKTTVMPMAKEYHCKGKYRVDFSTPSPDGSLIPGATIVRMDKNLTWILVPQQNVYYETVISPDFRATMQAGLSPDKSKMKLIGTEVINGQPTDKYDFEPPLGHTDCKAYTFLSKDKGLPVRVGSDCGSAGSSVTDYTNTKADPQPDDLFEVPAGYKKTSL